MPRKHIRTQHAPLKFTSGAAVCGAKRRFMNRLDAERAAELKNLEDITLDITVYKCDFCKKWHLTRNNHSATA